MAKELKAFIRLLVDVIREVSKHIEPFMPDAARSINQQIGADKINKGSPLFPRIE
jgi:methionyl-tRNA synthetase